MGASPCVPTSSWQAYLAQEMMSLGPLWKAALGRWVDSALTFRNEQFAMRWSRVVCFCSRVKQHGNLKGKKKKRSSHGVTIPQSLPPKRGRNEITGKWLHYSHNTVANVIKCCDQGRQQTEGDFGEEVFELGLKNWITGAFQTKEKPESIKAQRCQKCRFAGNRKGKPWEETGQERWVAAGLVFLRRGELHSCM